MPLSDVHKESVYMARSARTYERGVHRASTEKKRNSNNNKNFKQQKTLVHTKTVFMHDITEPSECETANTASYGERATERNIFMYIQTTARYIWTIAVRICVWKYTRADVFVLVFKCAAAAVVVVVVVAAVAAFFFFSSFCCFFFVVVFLVFWNSRSKQSE